eukprot:6193483-Pleurochrysis_carterae.AAC.2
MPEPTSALRDGRLLWGAGDSNDSVLQGCLPVVVAATATLLFWGNGWRCPLIELSWRLLENKLMNTSTAQRRRVVRANSRFASSVLTARSTDFHCQSISAFARVTTSRNGKFG